jgi:hypothetical protein
MEAGMLAMGHCEICDVDDVAAQVLVVDGICEECWQVHRDNMATDGEREEADRCERALHEFAEYEEMID